MPISATTCWRLLAAVSIVSCSPSGDDSSSTQPLSALREITPDSVILDYSSGQMIVHASLDNSQTVWPDTVWVWSFFTNPALGGDGSWSDEAIPVVPSFGADHHAPIRAEGPFHWASNTDLPQVGYRSRVYASPTKDAAGVKPALRDRTPTTMLGVLVRGNK